MVLETHHHISKQELVLGKVEMWDLKSSRLQLLSKINEIYVFFFAELNYDCPQNQTDKGTDITKTGGGWRVKTPVSECLTHRCLSAPWVPKHNHTSGALSSSKTVPPDAKVATKQPDNFQCPH